jgi:FkbM family methyltransferase
MSITLRYLYRAFRYRWRVDPAEVRFVCQCLQSGQVAADIGCHKGAYSYWMRRRVGPSGAVFAFEPQPRQVAYLREAFSAMRYENVALVPLAVSNQCGVMPLHVPTGAGMTHAASLEVRRGEPDASASGSPLFVTVTTLDDFFAGKPRGPNFLKIDVEGHELAVLQGGRQILEKHHPSILLECEARHRADGDVRPVFNLLQSLDYEGSFFLGRTRRSLADFDAAVHQWIDPSNPEQLPNGYVNNFAFVPAR